jgi:ankyrin repeat protein
MRTTALLLCLVVLLANAGATTAGELILNLPQLPNGGYQATDVPFPPIVNSSTLRMTLERGHCLWACPSYRVEIHGDGSVLFYGEESVVLAGPHRTAIPKASVERLLAAFRKARFFSLLDTYSAPITDSRTYTLSISFDDHRKTVEDYEGDMIGMPARVTALEDLIDKLARPKRWIQGGPHAFDDLNAEGWDFGAEDDDHQKLLASVAASGDFALLGALLDAGARPRGRYGCEAARSIGKGDLFDRLLRLGAPIQWRPASREDDAYSCNLLTLAAADGDPQLLRRLLARKPDVNLVDGVGQTALASIAYEARDTNAHAGADVAACAKLLIKAGADLESRDRIYRSTALMMSYDARVTQVLLDAGADPYARDSEGRTALDWALMWKSPSIPVLKRWMAAHPQKTP